MASSSITTPRRNSPPSPGKFPNIGSTLRARVLVVLLASDDMTGVESIFEHARTSLNTVIRALTRKYHWPIERRDFPVNIGDGRSGWASTWCLPQEVIDAALEAGGRDWLDGMAAAKAAGAKRRGPGA